MIDFNGFRKAIDRKYSAALSLERVLIHASKEGVSKGKKARGRSTGKKVEEDGTRVSEAEEALNARKKELLAYKDQLTEEIEKITDPNMKRFLKLRYLDEISVPNIAVMESFSESSVYETIRKAEKIINQNVA